MDDDKLKEKIARTEEETDEKCPACGGTLVYNPESQKLKCEYCGTEVEFEEPLPEIAREIDFDEAESYESRDWGAEKKVVICNSCGAESVYDVLQIADVCPYCGSNLVTEAGGEKGMAPGGVLGFLITAKQAAERFRTWIKRKIFAPKEAKLTAAPDAFKGVYLPYWTFDSRTTTHYTARYGRNRTVTVNGKTRTVVDWYGTSGVYCMDFDDLLIPGTNRYDKKALSRIGSFDTSQSRIYKPEYIAGFIAEKYTVGLKDAWENGKVSMKGILEGNISNHIRRTCHADQVSSLRLSTSYEDVKFKYLLLPVWMSSFKYKGKIYNFMVNGQTGKVGGKAPVSPWKVAIAVILGLVILGTVFYLLSQFGGNTDDGGYYYNSITAFLEKGF